MFDWMPNWLRFVVLVIGIIVLNLIFRLIRLFPPAALIILACAVAFLIIRHVNRSKNMPKTEKKDTETDDAASAEPYQILKRMMEHDPFTSYSPKDGQSLKVDAKVEKCACDYTASSMCATVSFSDGFSYKSHYTSTENKTSLSADAKENLIYEAILEHNRLLCEAHSEYNVNELNREASIHLLEAKKLGHKHVCSDCGNTYVKTSAFAPCPYCELRAKENETRQADIQRKAAEITIQDDAQTPPEHSEWAAWAKDKSNHERLQKLCGVKLVHTENQGMFTAYSYTLGPKGWNDIKRIMVTIADSDRKAGASAILESGGLGSEKASETIEIPGGKKTSEMDIELHETSWMRLTMNDGSKNMGWKAFRLLIYNQTGHAAIQIPLAPKNTGEITLYLCGVLAATFGIAGKAPSGDVEQGIYAVIEYLDAQKDDSQGRKSAEHTERTDSAQSADSEPKENIPDGLTVLRSLPDVWVVLGTGLPKKWPAIDVQGFFHVFTAEEAANAFAQPNGFGVEKMTGAALCECLKEWQRYGITHILLHQGNETRKFLEKELSFGNNFNSDLQETMIRYLQTKTLNIDGAVETAKIFWVLLCKMIPERLFLVPFCFEGEDINAPVEDNTLRLFPNAARLIMKQRAEGKILLFDGYPFADKADGRPMHFRTLRNGATGLEVLSIYTDFHEMLPIWKGRAHFALATFDDFKDNYQPTCGVMINPMSQALLLEPKDIEEMKKN